MSEDISSPSWTQLICSEKYKSRPKFKSRTCCIVNDKSTFGKENQLCPCQRLVRRHSFTGDSLESKAEDNSTWQLPSEFFDGSNQSCNVDINVFGVLNSFQCKFLRIDTRINMEHIVQLLIDDCNGKPNLIMSIYGGAKYFTMTERLEKEFIRGIVDAATMADAWILTAGISSGVSKLVGEGIAHHHLLHQYSNTVKCIGLTMWGTVSEDTRRNLKSHSFSKPLYQRQIPDDVQEDKETIEENHTHCILFDSGRLNEYLSDSHRNKFVTEVCKNTENTHTCYAVTIIVEGGTGSLEVIENDIKNGRPIVLIQGSGRLADVLATLVEQTSNTDRNQNWCPSEQEIDQALERFYTNLSNEDITSANRRISEILKEANRHLLHVYCLERDKNVVEIIFKAIFTVKSHQNKLAKDKKDDNTLEQEKRHRQDEDKLVDLALEWNYLDGVLPILQARHGDMARKKKKEFIEDDIKRQKEIFIKSLEKNRPTFIEYFLSAGFDPLTLADRKDPLSYRSFMCQLYAKSREAMSVSYRNRVSTLFGNTPDNSLKIVDDQLNRLIGAYFDRIYSLNDDHLFNRVKIDLTNHVCTCCSKRKSNQNDTNQNENEIEKLNNPDYTKYQILRDLFLWSIFMDMPDMAKVLLLHTRSRICASLIASALFKEYASLSPLVDLKDKFAMQSLEFETYAAMSLNKCYEYNEEYACELLLRRVPLFGNVSCMQIAIASQCGKLVETACFDQTLNQVWYNKLSLANEQTLGRLAHIPSIFTGGLLAPVFITYRNAEERSLNDDNGNRLYSGGIDYYVTDDGKNESKFRKYGKRFLYFHTSPLVKMAYHFISYILFLLIFSYMMLYHLDARDTFDIPHWTEIYVIITVSTMFIEEIRKLYHDYTNLMVERWGSTGSTIVTVLSNTFYILPYLLFYIGLGFRYSSYTSGLLSAARIIWALDLELWYLRSLKFVMAFKSLGPKLFMLKNMLRDLFAFVYMIFIAIAAYGVVSRSLILYKEIPFTGQGIFSNIFYEPYWFIYGEVSDKDLLDEEINNSSSGKFAEATATHVLLSFHMLFINILLLNLLIAVFTDSIDKVQENTEFYWRHQRYSLVREYFGLLPLGYPPLVVIYHVILFILFLRKKCRQIFCNNQVQGANYVPKSGSIMPIFKMIPLNDAQYDQWDLFENAATYSYARSILEKYKNKESLIDSEDKRKKSAITNDSSAVQTTVDKQQPMEDFKNELLTALKAFVAENQKGLEQNNSKLEKRLDEMQKSLESMTGSSRISQKATTD